MLYYFIDLYNMKEEIIRGKREYLKLKTSIFTGGPYEEDYGSDVITPLLDSFNEIETMFKIAKPKEDEVSNEELAELVISL